MGKADAITDCIPEYETRCKPTRSAGSICQPHSVPIMMKTSVSRIMRAKFNIEPRNPSEPRFLGCSRYKWLQGITGNTLKGQSITSSTGAQLVKDHFAHGEEGPKPILEELKWHSSHETAHAGVLVPFILQPLTAILAGQQSLLQRQLLSCASRPPA